MGNALGNIGGMPSIGITRASFEQIEDFIADNEASIAKVNAGIDLLAQTMVMVIKGIAQTKSGGPVAPGRRSNPALANRIPVQRITGNYFAGWTLKRAGQGHWIIYNDVVEAYLIETGLFQRVRRPVLKMSLIGMLQFIQTTRTADRFLEWVLAPRRAANGQFTSFASRLSGTTSIQNAPGDEMGTPSGDLP